MQTKDFESKSRIIETPNGNIDNNKSLENPNKLSQRVDINVLKSRLREKENIILKKYPYFNKLFNTNNCCWHKCYVLVILIWVV